MKANELRIGNLILVLHEESEEVKKVDPVLILDLVEYEDDPNADEYSRGGPNDWYSGIELNDEWFKKFGFEISGSSSLICYSKIINGGKLEVFDDGSVGLHGMGNSKSNACCPDAVIEHVHQLQNLYFALTGKELEVTPS